MRGQIIVCFSDQFRYTIWYGYTLPNSTYSKVIEIIQRKSCDWTYWTEMSEESLSDWMKRSFSKSKNEIYLYPYNNHFYGLYAPKDDVVLKFFGEEIAKAKQQL